jgi:D-alanyl-D-alanine carboxypeptidase/D-alanyl-D-alanine-endopeptidase (penicillin-binding protein 4)
MAKFEELNVQYSMINIQFLMKKIAISFYFSLLTFNFFGQTINQKLQKAFTAFEKDSQLKHAISSLYVIDASTGQVLFDKNSQIGLAPASTQKIITSVTAFELLGKDYRYKTEFWLVDHLHVDGNSKELFVSPSVDPTFGSWRYISTSDSGIFENVYTALKLKSGVQKISLATNDNVIRIPDGWIWQDIGNYYGAAPSNLIWRENQFDIVFKTGRPMNETKIIQTFPENIGCVFNNQVVSGKINSGDNAYAYLPIGNDTMLIKGTLPPDQNKFTISASLPDPTLVFLTGMQKYLSSIKRKFPFEIIGIRRTPDFGSISEQLKYSSGPVSQELVYTHYSPTLDSIIYWFNKKSINLYGEALITTFAFEKRILDSAYSGVAILQRFWKENGIDEDEINIVDGSGLSPLNRVTTHSQVEILKYATTKNWFPYFKTALPEYNGMSMKSGTIRGVKGFCGYHKAKNGKEYIFSFLVNNYNGSASALVNKMYKVLDILK